VPPRSVNPGYGPVFTIPLFLMIFRLSLSYDIELEIELIYK